MRPHELSELLSAAIAARKNVLITGAPGIGKSDVVAQACAAAGAKLVISHPAVVDPTDVKGLPWVTDGAATFLPLGELAEVLASTEPTVWFLDDFGQGAVMTQQAYMQWLLARRCGTHVLPDCVTILAATNRRTDRAGVTGVLEPVKSRFATIVELAPHLDDWCAWAFTHEIPAELIAFLRFRPDLLSDFKPSADLTNSPSPRTWAHVAELLAMPLSPAVMQIALAGAAGEGAATEFNAFRRLYAELPNIDGILIDPDASKLPTAPATLYAVATALGMKATPKNFPRVARYAERLTQAQHGEFAALLLRDAVRRDAAIMQTSAFVKLASGELGQLIAGGGK